MSIDPRFAALLNRQAGGAPADTPAVDTSEQIYISSLALLKMLKHGRAGVPMEVVIQFIKMSCTFLDICLIVGDGPYAGKVCR